MATYVLVHGGGHGGWCYQPVARILQAEGHTVYAPTLTGLGERSHLLSPEIDLDLHIRDVVALLHYEDLRDVILVGHSYGGMVITGDRRPRRRPRRQARVPRRRQPGERPVARRRRRSGHQRGAAMGEVVDGVELVLLPAPGAGMFYGVTDPDVAAWMDERLTGHPWQCFEQPLVLTNEDALLGDPAVPHRLHLDAARRAIRELMDEARAAGRLWDIDTGHDLMLTEPQWVADTLVQVAADSGAA